MARPELDQHTALIVGDVQNDFIPGGALPTAGGDQVVQPLNSYIQLVTQAGGKVFASRDWHPENHTSFRSRGGPWPPHCVQNSWGAQFHPDLRLPADARILSKAYDPDLEAYSSFDGTGLASLLREGGVTRVLVGGLATDYCVYNTILDALKLGLETWLLTDAIRAIDAQPGDGERAIERMLASGAKPTTLEDLGEGTAT
jgi:nicotinamidase/pyrazinamidase